MGHCKREDCLNKNSESCNVCKRNYPVLKDMLVLYIPTCPHGYKDCVNDPAYIKWSDPEWYEELYGNKTPEEASKENCSIDDNSCYDDEDK